MSSPVSRGFRHLRRPSAEQEGRVPPGQYVTQGFPVLSAGPTPHTPLSEWTFSIRQGGDTLKSWTWAEFQALPAETVTTDIRSNPSTAARPGCSFRTCTSGRARNGCAAWSCSITTNPVSGRPTATTCMGTHGKNSGTRATDLAGGHRHLGDQGNGGGPHDRAGGARLARAPGRAAPGRPPDR